MTGRARAMLAAAIVAAGAVDTAGAQQPAPLRLRGVVWDSTSRAPLAGPEVQLASAEDPSQRVRSVSADSLGRFAFDSVMPGRYVATFFHARLDSLGITAPTFVLTVRDESPVVLAIPGPPKVVAAHCGGRDEGVVLGHLLDARTRRALARGTVRAEWVEVAVTGNALQTTRVVRSDSTNDDGWFALCDVPADADIGLVAIHGADTSGRVEVNVPPDGLVHRTLTLGSMPARVAGVVHTASGQPVAGARIRVGGTGLEARTDAKGGFVLDSVPGGSRLVEARKIGYWPDRRVADVTEQMAPLDITMATLKSVLDTVKVVAARMTHAEEGFVRRQKREGSGHFLEEGEIARINPPQTSDLLYRLPGISVVSVPGSDGRLHYYLRQRGGGMGMTYCLPAVFVDGLRLPIEDLKDIDWLVPANIITGMEAYPAATSPPEFATQTGCTTLVYWTEGTKPRRPAPVERPSPAAEPGCWRRTCPSAG